MKVGAAPTISVVIPVYNEQPQRFERTLRALEGELAASGWGSPEMIIVDDGSSTPVLTPNIESAEVRIIRQENRGRMEARRAGIQAARGDYVLLLDSRAVLDPGALSWVADRVAEGAHAWNGHCVTDNLSSPYARFWDIIVSSAWSDYLRAPRTTSFGIDDYDRYPKGTTQFLAPRAWLQDALEEFQTLYADSRFANDDTVLLRSIAMRDRIHISPSFGSRYHARERLIPFIRHTFHRGTVFIDGHGRRGSRFRPVALAAPPASLAAAIIALRRPRVLLAGGGGLGLLAGAFARRQGRPLTEAAWFGVLAPPWALAYSAGIWRGTLMALRARSR